MAKIRTLFKLNYCPNKFYILHTTVHTGRKTIRKLGNAGVTLGIVDPLRIPLVYALTPG